MSHFRLTGGCLNEKAYKLIGLWLIGQRAYVLRAYMLIAYVLTAYIHLTL